MIVIFIDEFVAVNKLYRQKRRHVQSSKTVLVLGMTDTCTLFRVFVLHFLHGVCVYFVFILSVKPLLKELNKLLQKNPLHVRMFAYRQSYYSSVKIRRLEVVASNGNVKTETKDNVFLHLVKQFIFKPIIPSYIFGYMYYTFLCALFSFLNVFFSFL